LRARFGHCERRNREPLSTTTRDGIILFANTAFAENDAGQDEQLGADAA
jgi:hypothetical protein